LPKLSITTTEPGFVVVFIVTPLLLPQQKT
jgi:hypothetical protein